MSIKRQNPACAGLRCEMISVGLSGRAVQNDYCTKMNSNLEWGCEMIRRRLRVSRTLGLKSLPYSLPILVMQFRVRKRKHTPGAQLQHQESASSLGPSPHPGDKPMAEIVAGSSHRKSKRRVDAGLNCVRHRGFFSTCFSRVGLNLHVSTNLPTSGTLLKALGLGFKPIGSGEKKAATNRHSTISANSARRKKLQTSDGQDKRDAGY